MRSINYRWLFLYKLALRLSYRRRYRDRYLAVSKLIPDNVRVVDYCCGDAEIYTSHLKHRNIEYLGLDFNERFISAIRTRGVPCQTLNIRDAKPVVADYSLMMGSLYQFIPTHIGLVDKILRFTKRFIISEPIKNHAESANWLIQRAAYSLNNPGDGIKRYRFTPQSFREFLANYDHRVVNCLEGEVEFVAMLKGDLEESI